jgi:hypothetical protein
MRILTLPIASVLLLAGCPTRDHNPAADGSTSDGNVAEHQSSDAGDDGDASTSPPNTITIIEPTGTKYTNGSVLITIATAQPATASITFLATGATSQTIGTLAPPRTILSWDTTAVPEGTYTVTAQLPTNGTIATSNSVTIVVDRTPPQVVVSSLVPAPGAQVVVLDAPIKASFSEPILASTLTAGGITVTVPLSNAPPAPTILPTTIALSADSKTATVSITSDAGVKLEQAFTATFAATITDLAGNPLIAPTVTWSWTVPEWIRFPGITTTNTKPKIVIGSAYQPFVAFGVCGPANPGSGCPPVLHIAEGLGQTWNDLGAVGTVPSFSAYALFLDSQDHPIVALGTQNASQAGEVDFASWDGTAWQATTYPPITLPSTQATNVDAVAVALDSMARPNVVYRGVAPASNYSNVYVATWTGTTWDTSLGAVADAKSSAIDIVVNDQDVPIVTVVNTDNTSGAFTWTGIAWSFTALADSTTTAGAGRDTSGNVVMLGVSGSSWVPEHLTNGTWVRFDSFLPTNPGVSSPSLTNTIDRQPVVAWYDPTVTPVGMAYMRWIGNQWDMRPRPVNGGGSVNVAPPAVVVDARNNVWVSWTEGLTVYVAMSNY